MTDHIGPTPWEACGNVIRDADSIEVCTVALWQKEPAKVARLLAAAPDVLEALETLVAAAVGMPNSSDNLCQATLDLAVEDARAAIAKARGERA